MISIIEIEKNEVKQPMCKYMYPISIHFGI